ncbi:hypothetical protein [Mycobacterium paraterrae]|uniref:2-polyprenyl-6-methoxyphenol hydroxylase-like oxidoreductase n=1 Tax=Mycobacterium paraterrae TaxID=577492 RepID=A0ABY3VJ70_9MYCO|nr:hypothetical protein [Mycobacterium paraterrae]UMB69459.1 hypothetical protein MKK62_24495 [Mycobacterium paraterrae]
MVITGPTIENSTGAGVLAYENGTVCLTLMGIAGYQPPAHFPDMLALADVLLPTTTVAALRTGEPLGEVAAAHYPTSVWRRYDKVKRFPMGLIVIGDAVCSFNPVYGQGMTSAALQAKVLRDCLADCHTDDPGERYFRGAAMKLGPIWRANRVIDFAIRPVDGWRAVPQRLLNSCLEQVVIAAAGDTALTEAFLRTQAMTDSSLRLLRPSMLMRVIRSSRRGMCFSYVKPLPVGKAEFGVAGRCGGGRRRRGRGGV